MKYEIYSKYEIIYILHTLKGVTFSQSSSRNSTIHAMFLALVNIFCVSKQRVCGYT